MKTNAVILELLKGLLESNDKKTLRPYIEKPDADKAVTGMDGKIPELDEDDMAELGC